MKYRIALWATAGFLVAFGWAAYFLVASKDHPIEPIVSTLVRLTCPVAIIGSQYPVSLYSALAANVATYALVSLVVETLLRQLNPRTNFLSTQNPTSGYEERLDVRLADIESAWLGGGD